MTPEQIIKIIAVRAAAMAAEAGVGGSETAGMIVSYLAAHPDKWEAFMQDGVFAFEGNWWTSGCLSWQGKDGKIWHPQEARLVSVVQAMRP